MHFIQGSCLCAGIYELWRVFKELIFGRFIDSLLNATAELLDGTMEVCREVLS